MWSRSINLTNRNQLGQCTPVHKTHYKQFHFIELAPFQFQNWSWPKMQLRILYMWMFRIVCTHMCSSINNTAHMLRLYSLNWLSTESTVTATNICAAIKLVAFLVIFLFLFRIRSNFITQFKLNSVWSEQCTVCDSFSVWEIFIGNHHLSGC